MLKVQFQCVLGHSARHVVSHAKSAGALVSRISEELVGFAIETRRIAGRVDGAEVVDIFVLDVPAGRAAGIRTRTGRQRKVVKHMIPGIRGAACARKVKGQAIIETLVGLYGSVVDEQAQK